MKFALVNFGNEESYGLLFAGTEFKKHGEIRFFDAEMSDVVSDIIAYQPDFLCFSPMTCFYPKAKEIENRVKEQIKTVSIYGGHHATNSGESLGDITVVGSVSGIDLSKRGIIFGGQTKPESLQSPCREDYYRYIPRMRNRYRKVMLSVTGCPFNCSYCSSAVENTRRLYGTGKNHITHRNMDDIFKEALYIKDCTKEIEWVDDDILCGDNDWLTEFLNRWIREIGLPMYISTTSINAIRTPIEVLLLMRKVVNCIGIGVQAVRPESLKLMNRQWDSKDKVKKAYDRLTSLGFRVNMQGIVGLPIPDPVEDALDTVEALCDIGPGSIVSIYPLQLYPGTRMLKYSLDNGYKLNQECVGDTNTGLPAIDFGYKINNRLRNICKLATMVVKYGINRNWLESMLDIELGESSKALSMTRYYECIKDRLPDKADSIFADIVGGMNVRF